MPPNIVFVLLDTARASNFSSYGHNRRTTPFIDSLAADGIRYRRAFANSIFSLPSYGSIFTGEYPSSHRAVDWGCRISDNRLIRGLNERGYTTQAVSTHLISGEFGIADAFDEVKSRFGSEELLFDDELINDLITKANREGWETNKEMYFDVLKRLIRSPNPKHILNGGHLLYERFKDSRGMWSDDGAEKVLRGARETVRSTSEPFFLFLNFVETHAPYKPPKEYIRTFMPDDVSFEEIRDAIRYSSDLACLGREKISDRQREILIALYDAELRYLDDRLSEFYAFLEEQAVAEDTVFVVVSDHGDFFGKGGLWGHQGRVYNEVCHVPLIVNYPWETSQVESEVVELRQLCDHLHAVADGAERTITPKGEALIEYYGLDTQLWYTPSERFDDLDPDPWELYECALVDGTYKLIWNARDAVELYDMRTDFGETNDISERNQEIVTSYQDRIKSLVGTPAANHREYRETVQTVSTEGMDETVEDRLRELGYME